MIANVSIAMISGASDAEISQAPTGAVVSLAGPQEWPGLNTQGVTHARLDFAIGGVVPLHTHPRAAETLLVLKGTIYTGFVSDDNVLYAATLQQGDVILFPKALLHFQLNVGNETAITFNTLTSQNPGLLLSANQVRILFRFLLPSLFSYPSLACSAKAFGF
jgi:quercetin dioxygenase-like cupin family protein